MQMDFPSLRNPCSKKDAKPASSLGCMRLEIWEETNVRIFDTKAKSVLAAPAPYDRIVCSNNHVIISINQYFLDTFFRFKTMNS